MEANMRIDESSKTQRLLCICGAFAILSIAWAPNLAQAQNAYTPAFTSDKQLMLPEGKIWREWIYVGGLVTPNALNGGEAPFPEHHMIYIDPVSWADYKKTGAFREGTVIAKELTKTARPMRSAAPATS
jgi:hypothetical protein